MERFPLTNTFEDPSGFCDNCGRFVDRLFESENYNMNACDTCMEDAQHSIDCAPDGVAPAGVCQGRYEIVCAADTIDQMRLALRAHESECSRCGCTRKTVASDRLYLNPAAVCCGEVA